MRKTVRICLMGVVGCAALVACKAPAPPPTNARVVVVDSPVAVTEAGAEVFPGSIHAATEADLSFRVSGKIIERPVDMGARVEKGATIATVDPEDARLNLQRARAAVAAAEADLWLSEEEERRHRDLKERGFVGQSLVDSRANATKRARALLKEARSNLDLAKNQSDYTRLAAQADGVITQVLAEPGMVVAAGQPIARFAANGAREVRFVVPEGRVGELMSAQRISVRLYAHPQRAYVGRIRDISPQADPSTRTHDARVTILEADEAVELGATANVVIGNPVAIKAFRLPSTAVGENAADQPSVWVVSGDADGPKTVSPRPVQVVQVFDGAVIVSGDLTEADLVVSAGIHLLTAGMPVAPVDRQAPPAL